MICPTCGRPAPDDDAPRDVELCLPRNCPQWRTVAVYDHEQRQWLRTDDDGFVLDGRRIEDVR
jgi:hypothetical protein